MSSQESLDKKPEFTRRSETESICTCCSQTIRADGYAPLEYVEDIHADVCLMRPGSAVRYIIW
jgi:hypothetical protein